MIIINRRNSPPPKKPTRAEIKEQANSAFSLMNKVLFANVLPETDIILSNRKEIRDGALGYYEPEIVRIAIAESYWKNWDTTGMIQVIFHEMIHMYNFLINGKEDVIIQGNGQYHTELFLKTAEQFGGIYPYSEPDPVQGYSDIELNRDKEFYIFENL